MTSLILEGGTFRPIFSAGVMDALLDEDIMFPYVIGVSAGICDGFSYVSKQRERNLRILMNHRNDKRYLGKENLKKDKSIFGLDFVYNIIPNKLYPFDWDTFRQYQGKILVGVTNAVTGEVEYKDGKELDSMCTMLRATCAIPFVFPGIHMDGQVYYDGGIGDPIPIQKAIKDGNDKHLIVLTRPKEYRKTLSRSHKITAKLLGRKYPKLPKLLLHRHIKYNKTVRYCEKLEKEGKAIILRPDHNIDSFEKDIDVLKETYDMGYNLAMKNIEQIRKMC
ncbi:MAG: patatin family protein [Anaerostipes sp.]|nr:patatin family protein [Anaerostipes sp.]MDD3746124.1 patatin family protein [Anaerostipes sp.]